jgi:PTS system nitrogen regulatory IIA component
MRLTDYLRDDLVLTGLAATDTESILEVLCTRFEATGAVPSGTEAAQALLAREHQHTTVLEEGVAVPHATLPDLEGMFLLVATAPVPLAFGPPEAPGVDLFFVLLSAPGMEGLHIKLLARICRLVRHPGLLEDVRSAREEGELLEVLRKVDSQHV